MFPIPWNKAYRKKDGSLVNIDDAMSGGGGGGGYTLPTASSSTKGGVKIGNRLTMNGEVLSADAQLPAYTASESGKVLTVNDSGELEWDTSGSGGGDFGYYESMFKRGDLRSIFDKSISYSGKYRMSPHYKLINVDPGTISFNYDDLTLDEIIHYPFEVFEYYNYLDNDLITALNAELLYDQGSINTITLQNPLSDYKLLIIKGMYDSSGTSQYDTTMIYPDPEIDFEYWFGVKDRNSNYSGFMIFSDATHGSIKNSLNRRFKLYGVPKT